MSAGGLVGSLARGGVGALLGPSAPLSALASVNVVGSFLLGLYVGLYPPGQRSDRSVAFWAVGMLGSFTTFSAFSTDLVELLADGRATMAAAYVTVSTVGGVAAALLGLRVGGRPA